MDVGAILMVGTFVVSQFSIGAVLGDWLFLTETSPSAFTFGTNDNCSVFKGDSFNLFSALCGTNIANVESPYTTVSQVLVTTAFAFAMILFMMVTLRRVKKWLFVSVCVFVSSLMTAACLVWIFSERRELHMQVIGASLRFTGIGWAFAALTAFASASLAAAIVCLL